MIGIVALAGAGSAAHATCGPVSGEQGSLLVVDLSSCGSAMASAGADPIVLASASAGGMAAALPGSAAISSDDDAAASDAGAVGQEARSLQEDLAMYAFLAAGFLIVGRQMRRRRGPRVVLS